MDSKIFHLVNISQTGILTFIVGLVFGLCENVGNYKIIFMLNDHMSLKYTYPSTIIMRKIQQLDNYRIIIEIMIYFDFLHYNCKLMLKLKQFAK